MVFVSAVAVFMMSSDSFYFLYHKASSREQPVVPNQCQELSTIDGKTVISRAKLRCKICLFTVTTKKPN